MKIWKIKIQGKWLVLTYVNQKIQEQDFDLFSLTAIK